MQQWRDEVLAAGYSLTAGGELRIHALINPNADIQRAENAYRLLCERVPDSRDALEGLAFILQHRGAHTEGAQIRKRLVDLRVGELGIPKPNQAQASEYLCAAEGLVEAPQRAPASYVSDLFDRYAQTFETQLVAELAYRVPELLFDAVMRSEDRIPQPVVALDAGCGTGLAGALFHPRCERVDGVDLSAEMLAKARERAIYSSLERADLSELLARRPSTYSLIVAADVFPYFGDLSDVFELSGRALKPGGVLCFTVEQCSIDGYRLRNTGRYQHGESYVRRVLSETGHTTIECQSQQLRHNHGQPVHGLVVVATRP